MPNRKTSQPLVSGEDGRDGRLNEDVLPSLSSEMRALRDEHKHVAWKLGILWKIVIFIGVTAVGGLGASLNAVHNAGEVDGDIKAQIFGLRRDLDRHEQIIQYLLTSHSVPK